MSSSKNIEIRRTEVETEDQMVSRPLISLIAYMYSSVF